MSLTAEGAVSEAEVLGVRDNAVPSVRFAFRAVSFVPTAIMGVCVFGVATVKCDAFLEAARWRNGLQKRRRV